MSEERNKSRAWIWWIVAFVVAAVMYPMSLGPALFICGFFDADERPVIGTAYAPLVPLYRTLRPYTQSFHDWGVKARKSIQ